MSDSKTVARIFDRFVVIMTLVCEGVLCTAWQRTTALIYRKRAVQRSDLPRLWSLGN